MLVAIMSTDLTRITAAGVDSIPGIGLPYVASAFGIFLLRQTFKTIPRELEWKKRRELRVTAGCKLISQNQTLIELASSSMALILSYRVRPSHYSVIYSPR